MQGLPFQPEQASSIARSVDELYYFLTAVTLFFTAVIFSIIFYFMIKYRRRSPDERPKAIEGSFPLEVLWTAIPTVIVAVIFVWSSLLYFRNSEAPKGAMEIFVTGKQWMWKVEHPEGQREINELHVPLGRPVKLTMTSEDVIHDFFVPAFRVKKDVLPGRYTSLWFSATKVGTFHLFCAQYCGAFHAGMIRSIIVQRATTNMNAGSQVARRANRWSRRGRKYFRRAAVPRATWPTGLASAHRCSVFTGNRSS